MSRHDVDDQDSSSEDYGVMSSALSTMSSLTMNTDALLAMSVPEYSTSSFDIENYLLRLSRAPTSTHHSSSHLRHHKHKKHLHHPQRHPTYHQRPLFSQSQPILFSKQDQGQGQGGQKLYSKESYPNSTSFKKFRSTPRPWESETNYMESMDLLQGVSTLEFLNTGRTKNTSKSSQSSSPRNHIVRQSISSIPRLNSGDVEAIFNSIDESINDNFGPPIPHHLQSTPSPPSPQQHDSDQHHHPHRTSHKNFSHHQVGNTTKYLTSNDFSVDRIHNMINALRESYPITNNAMSNEHS
eukprot:m.130826 g.130826  ORF g.130826 m.130826 type:complete len:296 (+) comp9473_c0_seq8:130-1017(+)